MNRRLVIVGAGGFGREVHSWVKSSPRWTSQAGISDVVFVDDHEPAVPVRAPIVSTLRAFSPEVRDVVVCAIGSPNVRIEVVAGLLRKNVRFVTFIHDRVVMGDNVNIGVGSIVCPNALLSSDIRVGEHAHINAGCAIGHDVTIGNFVTLSAACNLTGNVVIEDGAFLATAANIIPGKRIGAGSFIGAGSVVLKNVPANTTVFGNPSVIVGKRPA